MGALQPALLAFVVAALVTGLELVTTQYGRSARFIFSSVSFYLYLILYGAAALVVFLILPDLPESVTIAGVQADNPWVQASVIGVAIKALLHIRFFSVSTGPGRIFPIGLETVVILLGDRWLLRNIELHHFNGLMSFLEPRAERWSDVEVARQRARDNIPNSFTDAERAALQADLDQAPNTIQVLQKYVDYVGLKTVERVFPEAV